MTYKKKLKNRRSKKRRQKGGLLVSNPELDLINTHMCNLKPGKIKETIGEEIYTYNGNIFQLNRDSLGFLLQNFRKSDDKWFKFIIFKNDDDYHIYLINGGKINKHSVCMLIGLLNVTSPKGEYSEIRDAVKLLEQFKMNNDAQSVEHNEDLKKQSTDLINNLDNLVNAHIKCMPVSAAGSGTVNDDNSICINDKSGHYKPNDKTMDFAKTIFENKTGVTIHVTEKVEKQLLKQKYGNNYENYTGICL